MHVQYMTEAHTYTHTCTHIHTYTHTHTHMYVYIIYLLDVTKQQVFVLLHTAHTCLQFGI